MLFGCFGLGTDFIALVTQGLLDFSKRLAANTSCQDAFIATFGDFIEEVLNGDDALLAQRSDVTWGQTQVAQRQIEIGFGCRTDLLLCSTYIITLLQTTQEGINAAFCVNDTLFTRIEGMAVGADVDLEDRLGAAGLERMAASAADVRRAVLGVDAFLHDGPRLSL